METGQDTGQNKLAEGFQTIKQKRRLNIYVFFACLILGLLFLVLLWQGSRMMGIKNFPEALTGDLFSAAESKYAICVEHNIYEPDSLDMLYYVFPGLRTVHIMVGFCLIALSIWAFVAFIRNVRTRKCALGGLILIFASALILKLAYCAAASWVMSVPFYSVIKEINAISELLS